MEFHEVANVFPVLEGPAYEEFKEDIRLHGLRDTIVLHEGKVLDGRNRYRACNETDKPIKTCDWDEEGLAVDFVKSANLHRRQLTTSQRGMAAARARPYYEIEAKKRQQEGQGKGGTMAGKGRPKIACASTDAQAIVRKSRDRARPARRFRPTAPAR